MKITVQSSTSSADYDFFPAVKHDVDLFVAMKGLPPPQFPPHELKEGKRRMTWFLVKPL